jgi:hypothetical protein
MAPSLVTVYAEIGLLIARLLRAEGVVERHQGPTARRAKMLPMAVLGEADAMPFALNAVSAASSPEAMESAASENIPSSVRNRPRCNPRHVPGGKACLLGVNFGQTAGIA